MIEKRILFDKFEFPRINGFEYLLDEKKSVTDYLFVNGPDERFSMYFEDGFPPFTVPSAEDRPYCLVEIKKPGRTIKFFCPEKHQNIDTVVWYFYVELMASSGDSYGLPGQIRVDTNDPAVRMLSGKPPFIEILETVKLSENYA